MDKNITNMFHLVQDKVTAMVTLHKKMKHELEVNSSQLKQKEEQIVLLNADLSRKDEELNTLKTQVKELANNPNLILVGSKKDENNNNVKQRINELIKEVDTCMELLNN